MSAEDQDQRTHKPTPKRVQDFRKRGEIARSRDLTAMATLGTGALVGLSYGSHSFTTLSQLMTTLFGNLGSPVDHRVLAPSTHALVGATLPVVVGAGSGWLVATGLQLGAPPVLVGPKLDFSRLFNPQALVDLVNPKAAFGRALKAGAKVAFVGLAAAFAVIAEYHHLMSEPGSPLAVGARVALAVRALVLHAGGALAVLAGIDYALARRKINASMRMTTEEMKREHRESEGDPQMRRRRRQRMRELSRRRLAAAVKTADVVIVNPTEYAVALRYDSKEDRAPRVVAKGRHETAEKIRELAREAGIPIIAEPPLCRLIHKLVPEGREIPSALYNAVAEVLGYVYRLRSRRLGRGGK